MDMKKALVVVFLLLAVSLSGFAQESEETPAERKFGSLHKSLLIPGWGQIAEKRYIEGILFLAAEAFCVYEFVAHNRRGKKFYNLYKNADNVTDAVRYRELTEKHDTRRNQYLFATVGVWAVNLIDIYVIVRGKDNKKRKLRVGFESGTERILAFTISYTF